jgi:hypothetical protein
MTSNVKKKSENYPVTRKTVSLQVFKGYPELRLRFGHSHLT